MFALFEYINYHFTWYQQTWNEYVLRMSLMEYFLHLSLCHRLRNF